jgi:hypothetical protein
MEMVEDEWNKRKEAYQAVILVSPAFFKKRFNPLGVKPVFSN